MTATAGDVRRHVRQVVADFRAHYRIDLLGPRPRLAASLFWLYLGALPPQQGFWLLRELEVKGHGAKPMDAEQGESWLLGQLGHVPDDKER